MTQAFDMFQGLAAGLEDRSSAWRFIRGFAENWVKELSDGDGWGASDLDAAEERLGVPLPATLREAYALLGRRRDLTSNHDVLLSPAELYLDDRGEALVFRHENQGAVSWGVLVTELDRVDPGVVVLADLADKQAEKWEPWLDRLSVYFIEIVLSESLQAPEGLYDFMSDLDGEGVELLQQHYTQLPMPAYPICQDPPGTRWFLGPDVLLREDDGAVLLARARTEEALDGVRDQLPGDWLNDYR